MESWDNITIGTYAWQSGGSPMGTYRVDTINYDANGNILRLYRKSTFSTLMDNLEYNYVADKNLLDYVYDNIGSGAFSGDFDSQSSGNYAYDDSGNLVNDAQAGSKVFWNAYGKVRGLNFQSEDRRVYFDYGPDQNRVKKENYDTNTGLSTYTWYVRDAQGNVLAVYHQDSDTVTWSEQYLYGSSRLGSVEPDVTWHNGNDLNDTPYFSDQEKLCIGWKRYEISNHLGNVMAVLNDRKYYKDTDADDEAEYFDPVFMAATDYYPFGYEMPGRKYNFGDYRYGFNGKENDSDGEFSSLTHYDYGFRIYNPAIGRFLSVDPLTRSYPWYTPYQFAGNSPILFLDLDGREPVSAFKEYWQPQIRGHVIIVTETADDVILNTLLEQRGISRNGQYVVNEVPPNSDLVKIEYQSFALQSNGGLREKAWLGSIEKKKSYMDTPIAINTLTPKLLDIPGREEPELPDLIFPPPPPPPGPLPGLAIGAPNPFNGQISFSPSGGLPSHHAVFDPTSPLNSGRLNINDIATQMIITERVATVTSFNINIVFETKSTQPAAARADLLRDIRDVVIPGLRGFLTGSGVTSPININVLESLNGVNGNSRIDITPR
ncbi:RHS repeat-associated core domain-containing protein [Phaeodactylibacter xiamenensis]|jgi:RHS repeat-associated protein